MGQYGPCAILAVDTNAGLEQGGHTGCVTFESGQVERRVRKVQPAVNCGAGLGQGRHTGGVAVESSHFKVYYGCPRC